MPRNHINPEHMVPREADESGMPEHSGYTVLCSAESVLHIAVIEIYRGSKIIVLSGLPE